MNNTSSNYRAKIVFSSVLVACGLLLAGCNASSQQAPRAVASASGCEDVAQGNEMLARFYEPGAVVGAEPIKERTFKARAIQPVQTMGAQLHVRAEPGMTAPYLERVLACHVASGKAMHPNDPLKAGDGMIASLGVSERSRGFAVNVVAATPEAGREIWRRAEAFARTGGSVDVEQLASTHTPQSF